MNTPPSITLKDATIRYGKDVTAVQNASLTVKPGELHVLLGRSGSGKTTLLRALAGFQPLASGTLSLHGNVCDDPSSSTYTPPERRNVGVVFQDYALFPHLNVERNIMFGMPKPSTQKAQRWLERVGLQGYGTRQPSQLSGGEQQRVALARALAQKPSILLLDEPFSNLDQTLRHDLRRETRNILLEENVTGIFITHDPAEAFALGDRISVMHASRILQTDTPERIYATPKTRHVALSLGSADFFPAMIQHDERAQCALGMIPTTPNTKGGTIVIRPEQFIIGHPTQNDHTHIGTGTLHEARFMGSHTLLTILLQGGHPITFQHPAHTPLPDLSKPVPITMQGTAARMEEQR